LSVTFQLQDRGFVNLRGIISDFHLSGGLKYTKDSEAKGKGEVPYA